VIVDADVECGPFIVTEDQQSRRLFSAAVAAGGLPRLHRQDEATRHRMVLSALVGLRCLFQHLGPSERVAGNRETVSEMVAGPVWARGARVTGSTAFGVDDMNLPVLPAGIAIQDHGKDPVRRISLPQQPKAIDAIVGIDERLSGNGADLRCDKWDTSPDAKEPRRYRDAEFSRTFVPRDQ